MDPAARKACSVLVATDPRVPFILRNNFCSGLDNNACSLVVSMTGAHNNGLAIIIMGPISKRSRMPVRSEVSLYTWPEHACVYLSRVARTV